MKKVKLLKAHNHERVDYPEDTILAMSAADAAWCIAKAIAEEDKSNTPAVNAKPAAGPVTPSSTSDSKSQATKQETKS